MSERGAPTWPLPAVAGGPVIEGWRIEQSGWGVFSAHRDPERVLTEHEMLAGLTGHLVAETAEEILQLTGEQHRIERQLNRTPPVCPHCGRSRGDAPLIVTADESSVTAQRCARSYPTGADCLGSPTVPAVDSAAPGGGRT